MGTICGDAAGGAGLRGLRGSLRGTTRSFFLSFFFFFPFFFLTAERVKLTSSFLPACRDGRPQDVLCLIQGRGLTLILECHFKEH